MSEAVKELLSELETGEKALEQMSVGNQLVCIRRMSDLAGHLEREDTHWKRKEVLLRMVACYLASGDGGPDFVVALTGVVELAQRALENDFGEEEPLVVALGELSV